MPDWSLKTPVVFLIFNRPATAVRVFEAIRNARPPQLLVVADGPRPNRAGEADRVREVRDIVSRVDWECEVLTNYSEVNLGCRQRVSSGLNWAFGLVEEAIILEDDCVPHPTFFRFCEELLEKYRDDRRIMHISGDHFPFVPADQSETSYYFSRYAHVWGWATWRRAWQYYDASTDVWHGARDRAVFVHEFERPEERSFWLRTWSTVFSGGIDSWDYQWTFTCIMQHGLAIMPNVNLVSNIGFGADATHLGQQDPLAASLPTEDMRFPLKHPRAMIRNVEADWLTGRFFFSDRNLLQRAVNRLERLRARWLRAWSKPRAAGK